MGRMKRPSPLKLSEKLLQIREALGLSQNGMLRKLGPLGGHARRSYQPRQVTSFARPANSFRFVHRCGKSPCVPARLAF